MTNKKFLSDDVAFRLHSLNRNNANLALLKYRDFQGFLVTGPHSGTHWVKWMLSNAVAHHYNVAPPKYFDNASSNDLIGHPRHPHLHPHVPRIASTHSIAPTPLQWPLVRKLLPLPPYALVIRDIRDVLISNYEKWQARYNVSFHEYLKGDPWGKKYITDVYTYMRFMNRWGEMATRFPQSPIVLRYEDFRHDAAGSLKRIAAQFKLPLTDADIAAGVAAGAKDVMARHRDPNVPERALRPDGVGDTVYSDADKALLLSILDKHLEHDFGYGFFDKPRGFQVK